MKTTQPFAAGIEERRAYAAQAIGVPPTRVIEVERTEVLRTQRGHVDETVLDLATKEPAVFWRIDGRYYIDSVDLGVIAEMKNLRYSYDLGLYEGA